MFARFTRSKTCRSTPLIPRPLYRATIIFRESQLFVRGPQNLKCHIRSLGSFTHQCTLDSEANNSNQQSRAGSGSLHGFLIGLAVSSVAAALAWRERKRFLLPSTVTCCETTKRDSRSSKFNFFADVVEIASPSVVYIEKQQLVNTIYGKAKAVSSGSGFIVDGKGYVLTNAHVVSTGGSEVQVKLQNGRRIKGYVTCIDTLKDLALVKLDLKPGEELTALKFGSSKDLRPGEWVIAIGSPLSLNNTITSGIVSSVHRLSEELGFRGKPEMEFVQTDAPITVGNSGGPLVNIDGEVIGVNTMTAGPGISFAIPSDIASEFVQNAEKGPHSKRMEQRFAIGVNMLTITPQVRRSFQHFAALPSDITEGVFLASVWPGSAADRVGLMKGDVIVSINERAIKNVREVYDLVQSGSQLRMEIARGKHRLQVTIHPEPLN